MKVSELYAQTARLGFEDSLDDEKTFYHSANRALLQVSLLRPAIGSCAINHHPLPNLLGGSFSPVERTDDLIFEATGAKAFYFETDGNGSYVLETLVNGEWETIGGENFTSLHHEFKTHRGFVKREGKYVSGAVRLRFLGDFLYHVRRVSLYSAVYSDNPEDIPAYEPFVSYFMPDLAEDFIDFASPPVDVDESYAKMSVGYTIEGKSILLPHDHNGIVRVLYRRRPKVLIYSSEPGADSTVIDLDEELCTLLPILVAAYVWLEDEEGKATYYMDLYRERAAQIERKSRNLSPSVVKNAYGW